MEDELSLYSSSSLVKDDNNPFSFSWQVANDFRQDQSKNTTTQKIAPQIKPPTKESVTSKLKR